MQLTKNFQSTQLRKLEMKIFERLISYLERKEFLIEQPIKEITLLKKELDMLIHQKLQEDFKTLTFNLVMIILPKSQVLIFITCIMEEDQRN